MGLCLPIDPHDRELMALAQMPVSVLWFHVPLWVCDLENSHSLLSALDSVSEWRQGSSWGLPAPCCLQALGQIPGPGSLLLNTLSRFVIAFLPWSKFLLILWLQSSSTVILEPKKIKVVTVSTFFPFYLPESNGTRCQDLSFWHVEF